MPYALQSRHLTCVQHALLAPPVQVGVRQHTRRRSNAPRCADHALGNVDDQVHQLLWLQLERLLLNHTIQDGLFPLVDGLARLFVTSHMPQEPNQGRRLRPFQLEEIFSTSPAAGAAATSGRIAHIQIRVRR